MKRTVGKANKGMNVEKIIIGLEIFKLKLNKEKGKKNQNLHGVSKAQVEAEV